MDVYVEKSLLSSTVLFLIMIWYLLTVIGFSPVAVVPKLYTNRKEQRYIRGNSVQNNTEYRTHKVESKRYKE
jgi:hypothetical protein